MKILNFKLFEYRTGKKIKTRWTVNDAIITLYYEKFGLHNLGILEDEIEEFVNWNIGSTESSLKMQALNIKYILSIQSKDKPTGLPDFSKAQIDAVIKYNKLTETELRKVVQTIINNISDEEKLENIYKAENKKKEEEKTKTHIVSPLPKDRFGNLMKKYKDVQSNEEIPFNNGDIIYHKRFGKGIVIDINGNLIEVKFDSKEKSILLVYSNKLFSKTPDIVQTYKSLNSIINDEEEEIKKPKIKPEKRTVIKKSIIPDTKIETTFKTPTNIYGKELTKIKKEGTVPFKLGDIVNHKKFGEGKVIDINDNIIKINFDNFGIKPILYNPNFFN